MSQLLVETAESVDTPLLFKQVGFVVRPKDITKDNAKETMFYVDCPAWRKVSVHASFTNIEAAHRYIEQLEVQFNERPDARALWC